VYDFCIHDRLGRILSKGGGNSRDAEMNGSLWTRREWLVGIAAWLNMQSAVTAARGEFAAAPDRADEYIDAHVHVWTPDKSRYPRVGRDRDAQFEPASFAPEELFANAKPCGVNRVVLVQMNFYGFDNSYMLDAIKQYKGAFRGVAVIDETAPNVSRNMRNLATLGVRGFRISPGDQPQTWLDSPGMAAMWKCAAETSQAMCALVNPDGLSSIHRMCTKFPETKVVIDHLARLGMDGPIRDSDISALCDLARHKYVYVKVSAFYALGKRQYPYQDLAGTIRRVRDAYGATRLMWGSDSPFQVENGNTYAGSIELVRDRLDFLTTDDRKWMLRRTAEEVFFEVS
jgi:predicted TIM-barrel fold metal-dependent hydrolase